MSTFALERHGLMNTRSSEAESTGEKRAYKYHKLGGGLTQQTLRSGAYTIGRACILTVGM